MAYWYETPYGMLNLDKATHIFVSQRCVKATIREGDYIIDIFDNEEKAEEFYQEWCSIDDEFKSEQILGWQPLPKWVAKKNQVTQDGAVS